MSCIASTALEVRPDVITSGRLGFKVETRRRLGRILVRLEPQGGTAQTVREYRLDYEPGSFGKSRLKSVAVYGAGEGDARKLFHEHRFSYTDADLAAPFEAAKAWTFPSGGDNLPITRSGGFYTMDSGGLGYGMPAAVGVAMHPRERRGGDALRACEEALALIRIEACEERAVVEGARGSGAEVLRADGHGGEAASLSGGANPC